MLGFIPNKIHSSTFLMPQHISYCKLGIRPLKKNLVWSPDGIFSYLFSCLLQCFVFFMTVQKKNIFPGSFHFNVFSYYITEGAPQAHY